MTHRLALAALVSGLAVSLATPADAQIAVKAKRKFDVVDFQPRSGYAGTEVTIMGRGFRPQATVTIGGRRAQIVRDSPNQLVVRVAPGARTGQVQVHLGRHTRTAPGTFRIMPAQTIRSFSPTAGPPGTRVEIRGAGFLRGDVVTLAGQPLRVENIGPRRIVVAIPPRAQTGVFAIERRNGPSTRARRPFTVTEPAPILTEMTPRMGPPGTRVRLRGENLRGRDVRVTYGPRRNLAILSRGPRFIEVMVPQNARQGRYFFVRSRRGEARSRDRFQLRLAPRVTRIAPNFGAPGTRVTITGANFNPGDEVQLAGQPVRIINLRPGRMVVEVPPNARSGPFMIRRGNMAIRTRRFDVLYGPSVRGFSPASGPEGTRVTINGDNFGPATRVFYGRRQLAVLNRRGATGLEVIVPRGAGSLPFTIRNRGGEVTTRRAFQIHVFPTVRAMTPRAGVPGTQIVVTGQRLRQAGSWYIGRTQLRVLDRKPRRVVLELPQNAESGVLGWRAHGRDFTNQRLRFEVWRPHVVSSMSPAFGATGTRVSIRGNYFPLDARVWFDRLPMKVISRTPGEIVAVIPRRANGKRRIIVEGHGMRAQSPGFFEVFTYPDARTLTPRRGVPGSQVVVTGQRLRQASDWFIGQSRLRILDAKPRRVVLELPRNATSGVLRWRSHGGDFENTRLRFNVLRQHVIRGMSPTSGPAGTDITIRGDYFPPGAKVYFDRLPLKVLRNTPREIVARLPPRARGRRAIIIEGLGMRAQSPGQFEVIEPPQIVALNTRTVPSGGVIEVRVRNVGPRARFAVGGHDAQVMELRGGVAVLRVSPRTRPGSHPVVVRARGIEVASRQRLNVIPPFTIDRHKPMRGRAGMTIVVRGAGFQNGMRAFFGNTEMRVKRIDKGGTRLYAKIPNDAGGAQPISLEYMGLRLQSPGVFEVGNVNAAPPPPRGPNRRRDNRRRRGR